MTPFWGVLGCCWLAALVAGCSCEESAKAKNDQPGASSAELREPKPRLLYLPERQPSVISPRPAIAPACAPEMVNIRGQFCIDRYEASLVDSEGGRPVSPYYHPTQHQTRRSYEHWKGKWRSSKTSLGQTLAVPEPPAFQLTEKFEVEALSKPGVVPNGYLSAGLARSACRNAGKRLCTHREWKEACRGQERRDFPYGDSYRDGACNVFRPAHPAALLHDNPSINHLDPRLNRVTFRNQRLLQTTGATRSCASRWGDDAVYDMVGNLDEWVDDEEGVFVGGFYSRSTRAGCAAKISSHSATYFDYSLGVRCCKSL